MGGADETLPDNGVVDLSDLSDLSARETHELALV